MSKYPSRMSSVQRLPEVEPLEDMTGYEKEGEGDKPVLHKGPSSHRNTVNHLSFKLAEPIDPEQSSNCSQSSCENDENFKLFEKIRNYKSF